MWNYIWPLGLVIVSNTVYHLCTKESPANVSPFATLTVTYLIGAIVCAILNFVLNPGESLWKDITKMNWAPFVLGIVIVGLETGWIYAYKAGWQVSEGYIVQSAILAIVLLTVVLKLLLMPFSIKQQKNSIKQAKLRPKEMAIQKKYAGRNDQATRQKVQQEIQELYQKENFNSKIKSFIFCGGSNASRHI